MTNGHRPINWANATLEDVAEWASGGTPPRNDERFFKGDIPWVKSGELGSKFIRQTQERITAEGIACSAARLFPKGAVGIAMYGATIGKLSIWGIEASANQACAVAMPLPKLLFNEYLYYYLLSQRRNFVEVGKGGAQPNISQRVLRRWPMALPPLKEQHRIVAKIEELFSELDKGIENFKLAKAQLVVYRQALLKHAFEGELTTEWRAANAGKLESADQLLAGIRAERRRRWEDHKLEKFKGPPSNWRTKYKEPTALDTTALRPLPNGWVWASTEELGDVHLGRQRAPQHHAGAHMRKYLRVANVFEDRIDLTSVYEMNFTPEEFKTFELRDGDILLNEGQSLELVGRSAIYRNELPGACFTNTLVRFRAYPGLMTEFAQNYFKACLGNHRFRKLARWTTNIAHLGADRLATMEFPLPPQGEQKAIVEVLDAQFSVISSLESEIDTNLAKSEALRQSILKKAFAGELVHQDPNDEPASELLARIRAERATKSKEHIPSGGSKTKRPANTRRRSTVKQAAIELT